MKLFITLFLYNAKFTFNQVVYSNNFLINFAKSLGVQRKHINFFNRKIKAWSIIIYVIWIIFISLVQIFFHYIDTEIATTNILILTYLIVSSSLFLSGKSNQEFKLFFLNGSYDEKNKIRLLMYNEFAFAIIIFISIIFFSIPIFIIQPLLNGKEGALFVFNYISMICLVGIFLSTINFFIDLNPLKGKNEKKNVIFQIMSMCLAVFISVNTVNLKENVIRYYNLASKNNINNLISKYFSNINLYALLVPKYIYIILLVTIILLILLLKRLMKQRIVESPAKIKNPKRTRKFRNSMFLALIYYERKNLIFNAYLFIIYILSLLGTLFMGGGSESLYFLAITSATLVSNGLFKEENEELLSFYYYIKSSKYHMIKSLFPTFFCQFIIVCILLYISLQINLITFLFKFVILGFLTIIINMYLSINLYIKLKKIFQGMLPQKISKYYIYGFMLTTGFVSKISSTPIYIVSIITAFLFCQLTDKFFYLKEKSNEQYK